MDRELGSEEEALSGGWGGGLGGAGGFSDRGEKTGFAGGCLEVTRPAE